MRKLRLTKSGLNKIKSHLKELKSADIEDPVRSLPPGEWCVLLSPSAEDAWAAFINPLIEDKYACAQIIAPVLAKSADQFDPVDFVKEKVRSAYARRARFAGYEAGCRIFYGSSDGLPGLIIDQYANASVIQINTAGVDRYRDIIKDTVQELTNTGAHFLDNPKYREKESLPTYESVPLPALKIEENGISYKLRAEVIQKVGFYYDHRENRLQLQQLLARLKRRPERGLDLFCYAGAWGLNALKAGVARVDFVDQGDFAQELLGTIEASGLSGQGEYHRQDVFKFLDEAISKGLSYDLVLSDPPAFAKSALQKSQALDGYSKLHRKVFKLASPGAVCAFSSCTHYISHEEFQRNVLDAAHKEGKRIQLLYCGMQGWDHPVTSLEDRSNYIKSYFYILE